MDYSKTHSIYRNENIVTIMSNRFNECLEISLPNFALHYATSMKEDLGDKLIDCYGIMGIIDLLNASYLIVITDVELSVVLFKREIYKIKNVVFILLEALDDKINTIDEIITPQSGPDKDECEENNNIFAELRKIFANGFYFSNKYDLANSFSSHNQIYLSKCQEGQNVFEYDHIIEGNRNFLANWKFINKLIIPNQKNNTRLFVSSCIYGNIESCTVYIKGDKNVYEKVQIIVISRRNLLNVNLYAFKKGLSKNGSVSNLIETELIMIHNNDNIFSHIFLTSTLPIFFRNKASYTQKNIIKAFNSHFRGLIEEYNLLLMIGLSEGEKDKQYFDIFKNFLIANSDVFLKKCKYFFLDNINQSIKDIIKDQKNNGANIIDILGYAHNANNLKYKKDFSQIGTLYFFGLNEELIYNNIYLLSNKILSHIFKAITKSNVKITKINEYKEGLKAIFQKRKEQLMSEYNPSVDNNSIERQQRMLEVIFGKANKKLNQDYKKLREDFALRGEIKIFVGSWNVGGTNITKKKINLDSWLIEKNQNIIPDIYIVGFQEVMELNAGNIVLDLDDSETILSEWAKTIENSIQKVGNYKRLIAMNLVGINLYCYVLEKEYDNINNLTAKYVKTGFGGAGNKGSCCINFNYLSTSISVACSHLAAGEKKNKQRLKEIAEILSQPISSFENPDELSVLIDENEDENAENNEINTENDNNINNINVDKNSYLFKESDIWIIFGDLNFRIDLDYEEFSQYIGGVQNWQKVLEYDQFNKNKNASIEFQEILAEDPIIHPPSYKFMIGSDSYDYDSKDRNDDEGISNLSGKKRNPSWCDRILYKKNAFITKDEKKVISSLGLYNCVFDPNFQSSDHRPIFNLFNVIVFKDDEARKKKIERQVYFNNKLNIRSSYFKRKLFAI